MVQFLYSTKNRKWIEELREREREKNKKQNANNIKILENCENRK